MSEKKVECRFIFKLVTKYFLYGYLYIIGFFACLVSGCFFYRNFDFPCSLVSVLFFVCCFPLATQFFRIIISTRHKFRYYKISLYRLKTRGFKNSYFECEMHEPCFRLIIKDLLKENGYENEYCIMS